MEHADDRAISEWAKLNGFTIVSKDADFYQSST
jgi:predicted nuclease of predicted toxin-antitoxin system